ncbi:MAG: 30S ribosomal protein S17 [bacterium]
MSDHKQIIKGTVVRLSSAQTIKVASKVTKVHPLYRKRYSQVRHYVAHDPAGTAQVGDLVVIESCRPISKRKHWILQGAQIDAKA